MPEYERVREPATRHTTTSRTTLHGRGPRKLRARSHSPRDHPELISSAEQTRERSRAMPRGTSRRSHPKSRTGCATCKSRKVKVSKSNVRGEGGVSMSLFLIVMLQVRRVQACVWQLYQTQCRVRLSERGVPTTELISGACWGLGHAEPGAAAQLHDEDFRHSIRQHHDPRFLQSFRSAARTAM